MLRYSRAAGGAFLDVLTRHSEWWRHLETHVDRELYPRWWETLSPRNRARWLLGQLCNSDDALPSDVQADFQNKTHTYGQLARQLAKDLWPRFLTMVSLELKEVQEQLVRGRQRAIEARRCFRDSGTLPMLIGRFHTTTLSSQIAQLRNFTDPIVLRVHGFYSALLALEEIQNRLNEQAQEHQRLSTAVDREYAAVRVEAILDNLIQHIDNCQVRLDELRACLE